MTDQATIGAELVRARADGVPWKTLQKRYGYGRTRLWALWRNAKIGNTRERLVSEHLRTGEIAIPA